MKKNHATRHKILSATSIARKLRRSPQGVIEAITRLGITPALELPSGKYYSEAAVTEIESGMRRPNAAKNEEG
jgi:hypothetical protein